MTPDEIKIIDELRVDDSKYLEGKENWMIRAYFYCSNGLTVLNEFRNLFLGIAALYLTLHITSIPLIVVVFVSSIIILTITGYLMVHRVAKVREWLGVRFGSHYSIRSFNFQEESYKTLQGIKEILVKLNEKNTSN